MTTPLSCRRPTLARRSLPLTSVLALSLLVGSPAVAAPHTVRIPLDQGRIKLDDLSTRLQHHLNLPVTLALPASVKDVNLNGIKGALVLTAINESLPGSAHVALSDDELVLTFDAAKLPRSNSAIKKSVRTFVATMTPEATAAQRRTFGLSTPAVVDESRRMVVLVHGLDSDRSNWTPIAVMLENEGYQVAFFTYPSDQPIADSADSFAQHMQALKQAFPSLPVSVVAHSMGALVSRAYVEGDDYVGGVGHLILLAPPNHGTPLAKYRIALELQEHLSLARHEPNWRPSWLVTDGLGEAGRDLTPHSRFLDALNARPRREGVKYTIVAANQHPAYPTAGRALDRASRTLIPSALRDLPGLSRAYTLAQRKAYALSRKTGKHDGPVSVKSTRLEGVDDHVIFPTSHCELQTGSPDCPPASWEVIKDRLAR